MAKKVTPTTTLFPAPGNGERTPHYDERLAAILTIAAQVIAEEGYEKASMRQIAARAGVSIAGLYYYLKSKEEALYLIQLCTFDSLVKHLKHRLATDQNESAEARIRLVIENHLRHFVEHLPELKVCARELDSLKGDPYKKVLEKRREYYQITRGLIEELTRDSEQPPDSNLAALALFGMLNWVYMWFDPRRHRDLKTLEEQLSTIFIDGTRPR